MRNGSRTDVQVEAGDKCHVLHRTRSNRKKIWVLVRLPNNQRIEVPWWWLRPRSVLDDIVEA